MSSLTLSPREKVDLASQLEGIRYGLYLEASDSDAYTKEEMEWFRSFIPALDHASILISDRARIIESTIEV